MHIALKIDVDTYRGTREGVPALVELLQRYQAGATFLFNLGADRSGRAVTRMFQPGVLRKARRISALGTYGLPTLLRGTLLPSVDIGKRCADILRGVRDAGFEVGLHAFDRWRQAGAQMWYNSFAGPVTLRLGRSDP